MNCSVQVEIPFTFALCRHQHRRLLMALEESGLSAFSKRSAIPEIVKTGIVSFGLPFVDYILIYVAGCALSFMTLAVEAACHRFYNVNHGRLQARRHPFHVNLG